MKKIIIPLLAIIFLTGCATPTGRYFKNRGNDFLDIFKVRAGVGLGLHTDVQATDLAHIGVGGSVLPLGVGISHRDIGLTTFEINANPPIPQLAPHAWEKQAEYVLFVITDTNHFWITHIHQEINKNIFDMNAPSDNEFSWCYLSSFIKGEKSITRVSEKGYGEIKNPPYRWFDIEVGATLGFVGGRVGFSPGELVDFILGIFTIDIANDDEKMKKETK